MTTAGPEVREFETRAAVSPEALCRRLRTRGGPTLWLDGSGGFACGWGGGPLVAVAPRPTVRASGRAVPAALEELGHRLAQRRAAGGTPNTGVAVLAAYELFGGRDESGGLPELVALEVDVSVRHPSPERALWTARGGVASQLAAIREGAAAIAAAETPARLRALGAPRTSLPRASYLEAVERIKRHIERGEIYQANLCQRFEVDCEGDPFETHVALTRVTPAPRSAFVETPEFALASVSPETFLDVRPTGEIETRPIKGTRPRGATAEADAAALAGLLASGKDRAELVMIVDLERNDLSRVCRPGTVEVPEGLIARSFAAVHHLVARVCGRLADGVAFHDLVAATFPGGSISGAPKLRAIEILRGIEPARRGFFTGSLFWIGDDGTIESSILIRSWIFAGGRGFLGAGGGIVAESDPEEEWLESNHKARAPAAVLGFDPAEAR